MKARMVTINGILYWGDFLKQGWRWCVFNKFRASDYSWPVVLAK